MAQIPMPSPVSQYISLMVTLPFPVWVAEAAIMLESIKAIKKKPYPLGKACRQDYFSATGCSSTIESRCLWLNRHRASATVWTASSERESNPSKSGWKVSFSTCSEWFR